MISMTTVDWAKKYASYGGECSILVLAFLEHTGGFMLTFRNPQGTIRITDHAGRVHDWIYHCVGCVDGLIYDLHCELYGLTLCEYHNHILTPYKMSWSDAPLHTMGSC